MRFLMSPNLRCGDPYYEVRVFEPRAYAQGGSVLSDMAESVRRGGRGGDEILLHINPEEFEFLKQQWGEPSINPVTGIPEYGLFSKIKKALKFEAFNTKKIWDKIKDNPERLLVGAVDPLGTKIANKMYGQDWDPAVNQLGGATEDTFRQAEAEGMDTGLARDLHKTAGLVAGVWGGNALGNLASTGLGNVASGLEAYGAANSLTPAMTSVAKTGDVALQTQLGQLTPVTATTSGGSTLLGSAANVGADAARYGESALEGLAGKTFDAAKDPKNWNTFLKAGSALGALGGAGGGSEEGGGPPPDSGVLGQGLQIPTPNLNWRPAGGPNDYYTYGRGPEHSFYTNEPVSPYQPTAPQPRMGLRRGGPPEFSTGSALDLLVKGPGTGRSDEIPARLSAGEYVMDAETVALLGDGSSEAGARKLDQLRERLRSHKGAKLAKGKFSDNAKDPMQYLGEG